MSTKRKTMHHQLRTNVAAQNIAKCLLYIKNNHLKELKNFISSLKKEDQIALLTIKDGMVGTHLLLKCIQINHVQIFEYIVQVISSLNIELMLEEPDVDGNTPLIHAANIGNIEIVSILVEYLKSKGLTLNQRNAKNGVTPLYSASNNGHEKVVQFLLNNNLDLELATEKNFTPLAIAAQNGHCTVIKILMDAMTLDQKKKQGAFALIVAVSFNNIPAAQALIDGGIDPNAQVDDDGFTALHFAVRKNHFDMMQFLLRHKADPNIRDHHGLTSLHTAVMYNKSALVTMLLENGADVTLRFSKGETVLIWAVFERNIALIELFSQKRFGLINVADDSGKTPIFMAALADEVVSFKIAKILLDNGADPGQENKDGDTLLFFAAGIGNIAFIKYLAKKQIDINGATSRGYSPLVAAISKNQVKMVKYLYSVGATFINKFNSNHPDGLCIAIIYNNLEMIETLLENDKSLKLTPYHLNFAIALNKNIGIIEFLLNINKKYKKYDPKVFINTMDNGALPLVVAASGGSFSVVSLLIDEGADIEKSDSSTGLSALSFAAFSDNAIKNPNNSDQYRKTVEILLKKYSDQFGVVNTQTWINTNEKSGYKPMDFSVSAHSQMLEVFLKWGGKVLINHFEMLWHKFETSKKTLFDTKEHQEKFGMLLCEMFSEFLQLDYAKVITIKAIQCFKRFLVEKNQSMLIQGNQLVLRLIVQEKPVNIILSKDLIIGIFEKIKGLNFVSKGAFRELLLKTVISSERKEKEEDEKDNAEIIVKIINELKNVSNELMTFIEHLQEDINQVNRLIQGCEENNLRFEDGQDKQHERKVIIEQYHKEIKAILAVIKDVNESINIQHHHLENLTDLETLSKQFLAFSQKEKTLDEVGALKTLFFIKDAIKELFLKFKQCDMTFEGLKNKITTQYQSEQAHIQAKVKLKSATEKAEQNRLKKKGKKKKRVRDGESRKGKCESTLSIETRSDKVVGLEQRTLEQRALERSVLEKRKKELMSKQEQLEALELEIFGAREGLKKEVMQKDENDSVLDEQTVRMGREISAGALRLYNLGSSLESLPQMLSLIDQSQEIKGQMEQKSKNEQEQFFERLKLYTLLAQRMEKIISVQVGIFPKEQARLIRNALFYQAKKLEDVASIDILRKILDRILRLETTQKIYQTKDELLKEADINLGQECGNQGFLEQILRMDPLSMTAAFCEEQLNFAIYIWKKCQTIYVAMHGKCDPNLLQYGLAFCVATIGNFCSHLNKLMKCDSYRDDALKIKEDALKVLEGFYKTCSTLLVPIDKEMMVQFIAIGKKIRHVNMIKVGKDLVFAKDADQKTWEEDMSALREKFFPLLDHLQEDQNRNVSPKERGDLSSSEGAKAFPSAALDVAPLGDVALLGLEAGLQFGGPVMYGFKAFGRESGSSKRVEGAGDTKSKNKI